MNEYRFHVYLTHLNSDVETVGVFHSVYDKSYQRAYQSLLFEVPRKFSCDYFVVSPVYRVNGKRRVAR